MEWKGYERGCLQIRLVGPDHGRPSSDPEERGCILDMVHSCTPVVGAELENKV